MSNNNYGKQPENKTVQVTVNKRLNLLPIMSRNRIKHNFRRVFACNYETETLRHLFTHDEDKLGCYR